MGAAQRAGNALSPGFIATELSQPLLENPDFMARRMAMTPLRRPGTAAEIAGAAVFLASDMADYITGTTLFVDGGMTCYPGFATGG